MPSFSAPIESTVSGLEAMMNMASDEYWKELMNDLEAMSDDEFMALLEKCGLNDCPEEVEDENQ